MSESRLALDDLQVARQTMGVLAEYADVLWAALQETNIPFDTAEAMLLSWWNHTMRGASSTDFSAVLEQITKLVQEDE